MAAYAALTSLMHILEQIQNHPHPPITIDKQQMKSLCEIISPLQDFLENYSHRDRGEDGKEALESRIADAAYAAEVIESHIGDQILTNFTFHEENKHIFDNYSNLFLSQGIQKIIQILSGSTSHGYTIFCQALQKVIKNMDSVKKEVMKIKDKRPTRKNAMVSFDDVLTEVMDRFTPQQSDPQILPIVGSSGIVLTSLMHITALVHLPPRLSLTLRKQYMDSLCENLTILQDFLESYSHGEGCKEEQDLLEIQIVNAAYAAEDIILVDTIHQGSNNLFYQDLEKIIEDMNLIKKEVIEIQDKWDVNDHLPISISMPAGSSAPPPANRNNTMVPFDDALIEIMDSLTGHPTNLQVLPIVGMGGIGKTTLARNVYDHRTIVQHFHVHVWITISQEYTVRDILIGALSCLSETDEFKSENELGLQLYKSLCGRRYLIILDDVWSIKAWEKLMLFFPDNNNGSRIMITTRLSHLCNYFGSSGFKMNFLDEDKGWKLLCKIVFPDEQCSCPLELEKIGKTIARNCKGLPLSIVVIGGILANSERTQQQWEYVAKNLNSIVNLDSNEHCLNILSLSYKHLPIHLKPCFLHMGVFPEDKEIRVATLIQLWLAEGFLKPIKAKSLEEVADKYLQDLIDRNLLSVKKLGSCGEIRSFNMHDLLRDLCLKEAQKEKFLCIRRVHNSDILDGIHSQRRICIHQSTLKEEYDHPDQVLCALPSASLTRSLICNAYRGLSTLDNFRLLRVFKTAGEYPLEDVFQLVNSRYLDFRANWKSNFIFSSSINLLWNLQTLIVKHSGGKQFVLPHEIWEMSQLRHFEIDWHILPDPLNFQIQEGDDDFILINLHTILGLTNCSLSEEVIKRIPNIKKLQIRFAGCLEGWSRNYRVNNLGRLNKLESLVCKFISVKNPNHRIEFLQNFAFPHSLKKLSLMGTRLLWEDMRMIGSLTHLQVLKLEYDSFHGPEWNPVEGEFLHLKFLKIQECNDLTCWNADNTHFPCLEHLVLNFLDKLKEIPLDIGEISTLQSIQLSFCSVSAVISANNILQEQENLGNVGLEIRVNGKKMTEAMENWEIQRICSNPYLI